MKSQPPPDSDVLEPVSSRTLDVLLRHRERFRAFLFRRLGNEASVDELLQQALLKAVEHESSLEARESVVAWFYRILRNALIDHYRSRSAESKAGTALIAELESHGSPQAEAADELRSSICRCIDDLIPTLRPAYGELVRKIDLEGKSPTALAKELSISPENLSVRLHRARQALRKSLERSCGACAKHACLDCECQ